VLDYLHKFRVNLHVFIFMSLRNSRIDSTVLFWFIKLSVNLYSQEPYTGPYHEPVQSNRYHPILSL
jgi:hypothetical protein